MKAGDVLFYVALDMNIEVKKAIVQKGTCIQGGQEYRTAIGDDITLYFRNGKIGPHHNVFINEADAIRRRDKIIEEVKLMRGRLRFEVPAGQSESSSIEVSVKPRNSVVDTKKGEK